MFLNHRSSLKTKIAEVAIADLGESQIVVPTFQTATPRYSRLTNDLSSSRRDYSRAGWLVHCEKIIGTVQNLEIGALHPAKNDFGLIQRLGPAMPITFEVRSRRSLPYGVRRQTALTYQFRTEPRAYYSLFYQVRPAFVRIYSVAKPQPRQILLAIRQFLIDEKQFINQNRCHLKNVAFYRERFDLDTP